jgi:hypoxanthine phosphoribosyltransferase
LRSSHPASLKIVTLLDKPDRRKVDIQPDYYGFKIPDEFVVGYGLDFNEEFRGLPDICVSRKRINPETIKPRYKKIDGREEDV